MTIPLEQSVEGIESNLTIYTKSLDELRSFLNKVEQLEIFYKQINKELAIEDLTSFKNQLNFTGFLTISILDLLAISKNIIVAKQQWELTHQLKLGYLIIYETINSYHRHSEINRLAKKRVKTTELHVTISSELKAFKTKYKYPEAFTEIRNIAIAHVGTDFKVYYDTINKINGNSYFGAILSFLQLIYKMQELSKYLSDSLLLQKDGSPFNMEDLVKEMTDKINNHIDKLSGQ